MLVKTASSAGFLLLVLMHINHATASEEAQSAPAEEVPYFLTVGAQAEMEKCFGLANAKSKECVADADSDDCKVSEKKSKDGSEFTYVPRDSCVKQGGQKVMTKRPKPQK
ncbi:BufA1 family periplasmic bufferin-type metallophore [Duganella radicis]|uniref:DUF2282 domain-containing protein n=1 Tax=Duganella radicis TaxID=551988 RepID=A0A6L6PEV3_9BURK|nr:DUF2282 domain-containing protein [Duganella radicis]MTV37562.1 DUF2282 domain-containing protein [Duganella radicis]